MKNFYSSSSWISFVQYNTSNGNMVIHLKNGSSYSYNYIPPYIFDEFKNASSHGYYWNEFIKGKYA